jgi:hypothetical protein
MKKDSRDPFGAIRNGEGKGISKTTLPLFTVVIWKDGGRESRFIKIRMDGEPGRRWMPFARWWWEKNKGPVPAGHLVLHKDGDLLNDEPGNLMTGTPGMKLKLAHERDPEWSRDQHGRAAAGCAEKNRRRGRSHRFCNFLKKYWYPAVDSIGVILNVPFRRRKRVLACFGVDVSRYPRNGHGKKPGTQVQRALETCRVHPVKGSEFSSHQYSHYCVIDPNTREVRGPMSAAVREIVAHLERTGIWATAEKYGRKDLRERK